jgi:hypothetical protein
MKKDSCVFVQNKFKTFARRGERIYFVCRWCVGCVCFFLDMLPNLVEYILPVRSITSQLVRFTPEIDLTKPVLRYQQSFWFYDQTQYSPYCAAFYWQN